MDKIKSLFNNLDKTDLRIMKIGLKSCFCILIISTVILFYYLFFVQDIFLYELGLCIFKLSTYLFVEFIICGIVADMVKKQFG